MGNMKKTLLRAGICLSLLIGVFATDAGAQSVDNSIAKVQKMQGVYLFTDCEPVAEYEYIGTIDIKRLGGFKSPQYTIVRDALMKECLKEYPQAQGIIFHFVSGAADKADAIKFK